MLDKKRKLMACEDESPTPRHFLGEKREIKFTRCIGNYFSYSIMNYLEWHNKYEQGVLPFPGSMSEQPNKIIELFKMIDLYKQDKMKQEIQKQKMKDKAKTRGRGIGR